MYKNFRTFSFRNDAGVDQKWVDSYNSIKSLYSEFMDNSESMDNSTEYLEHSVECLEILLEFYLGAEKLVHLLLCEIFREEFYAEVECHRKIFIILDNCLRLFLRVDQKLHKSELFSKFSAYKRGVTESELVHMEKLTILSVFSMPMGQMFSTLFYSKERDDYYPSKLSKRSKIFLDRRKLGYLVFYYRAMQEEDRIYIQMYLLVIIEMFTGEVMDKRGLSAGMMSYVEHLVG